MKLHSARINPTPSDFTVLIRGLAGALCINFLFRPGAARYQLRRQGDKFRGAVAADSDFSLRARLRDKLFFPRVMLITSERNN